MFALWLIFHIKRRKSIQRSQNSASPRRPQLILAALGIDKAFGGAQYAADVLPLSSLYFPPAGLLGLVLLRFWKCQAHLNRHTRVNRDGEVAGTPSSVHRVANAGRDKRWHHQNEP